jgi:hypothetical protein
LCCSLPFHRWRIETWLFPFVLSGPCLLRSLKTCYLFFAQSRDR